MTVNKSFYEIKTFAFVTATSTHIKLSKNLNATILTYILKLISGLNFKINTRLVVIFWKFGFLVTVTVIVERKTYF